MNRHVSICFCIFTRNYQFIFFNMGEGATPMLSAAEDCTCGRDPHVERCGRASFSDARVQACRLPPLQSPVLRVVRTLFPQRCRGRGKRRLIQCIPRTVRNDAHLTTFLTGQSLQGQSPPRMLCLLERAASVRPHAYAQHCLQAISS